MILRFREKLRGSIDNSIGVVKGMSGGAVRFRISKMLWGKLFSSKGNSVSKGIDKVLERCSEKVKEDVLEEFLKEGR